MTSIDDAVANEIIQKIRHHELSATQVSDCLKKEGVLEGVHPLLPGMHGVKVGKVFFAYAYNESNWGIHEQIHRAVQPGNIVLVEQYNFGNRSVFGELVSTYLCKSLKAEAIVVNGLLRDSGELRSRKFPIWCKGVTPKGAYNIKNETPLDSSVLSQWKEKYEGTIAVCDDDGVTVIPRNAITKDFLKRLDHIKTLETTWFNCVEQADLSTYETVCEKKYEKDSSLIPGAVQGQLDQLKAFTKDNKW